VKTPETPGDVRFCASEAPVVTFAPVAAWNAANASVSGPAGMSNRCVGICSAPAAAAAVGAATGSTTIHRPSTNPESTENLVDAISNASFWMREE
jgi:hypothetical protein